MTLSKDRLRIIHGITESKVMSDEAVLARRKYHEAAARWLSRRSSYLQTFFAAIGFVVVLLPMFSKTWRTVIESTPVVSAVFHAYITFSGLAIVHLYFLMALFLVRNWQIKSLPGGTAVPRTYSDVLDMELFPRTRREEFAYWTDILFGFGGATLWLFLPFSLFAFFMNLRS